jgi:hypothetical protein
MRTTGRGIGAAHKENRHMAENMSIGENVAVKIEGKTLTLVIDMEHRGGLSPTGKTVRVASTLGNVKLPCGITIGLNAYVKP